MIRTNLSTRPFYNARAVNLVLLLVALVVVAATLGNLWSIVRYSRADSTLASQATLDGEKAAALRSDAAKLRASLDARQVELVSTEARLANDLIDRRVFSWTELFNQFEKTLPPEVRITAVRPTVERDGRIRLTVNVVARSVDDVNEFMEKLEDTKSFRDLLTREEHMNEEGQLESTLESYYLPPEGAVSPDQSPPAEKPAEPSAPPPAVPAPAPETGR